MHKTFLRALMLAVVSFIGLFPGVAAPATVALPGGKANWVVAVGGLNTVDVIGHNDWVRLGYYAFSTDGTVVTNWWTWSLSEQPVRVDGIFADCTSPVPDCYVKTVDGFLGNPMGGFQGAYSYLADGRLQIVWTKDQNGVPRSRSLTEKWHLETDLIDGRIARMKSPTYHGAGVTIPAPGEFTDYSATFGVGYGSNASLSATTKATMNQLRSDSRYNARTYTGTFVVYNNDTIGRQSTGGSWYFGSGNPNPGDANYNNPWQVCANGQCLGWVQNNSSCNCNNPEHTSKNRVRYIADVSGGRRNTEWYWCQCLAQGQPCYKANSHPRPLLQIVDDAGDFQGWVGVEAFTHVNTRTLLPDGQLKSGYFGIFDMVPTTLLP